jgi:hypothetical protein
VQFPNRVQYHVLLPSPPPSLTTITYYHHLRPPLLLPPHFFSKLCLEASGGPAGLHTSSSLNRLTLKCQASLGRSVCSYTARLGNAGPPIRTAWPSIPGPNHTHRVLGGPFWTWASPSHCAPPSHYAPPSHHAPPSHGLQYCANQRFVSEVQNSLQWNARREEGKGFTKNLYKDCDIFHSIHVHHKTITFCTFINSYQSNFHSTQAQ